MKARIALLLSALLAVGVGLGSQGCSSLGNVQVNVSGVFTPANTQTATTLAATLVLRNNPKLIPVVREIDAGVDAALASGSVTVDAQTVKAFVAPIAARHGLDPVDTALVVNLVAGIANNAAMALKVPALQSNDSRILPYVAAFHAGIKDALSYFPNS